MNTQTHKQRQELAHAALARAIEDGLQYEQIAKALGFTSNSLRGFAMHGKLGPDKTIALLEYLTEKGYMRDPQAGPRGSADVDDADAAALIFARQIQILADIWAAPFFDREYKMLKLDEFLENAIHDVRANRAAAEKIE